MNDALKQQHGGDHYKNSSIQPVEIAMANRYDACIFSTLKYVSRHRRKNGKEDLLKGQHFLFLRFQTMDRIIVPAVQRISVRLYCKANGLNRLETQILLSLHDWAANAFPRGIGDEDIARLISEMIDLLIAREYPES